MADETRGFGWDKTKAENVEVEPTPVTDAPERTLSEDHVTPATLAEADERLRDAEVRVAALEQERDEAWFSAGKESERYARLREAIREWVDATNAYAESDGKNDSRLAAAEERLRALTKGEN